MPRVLIVAFVVLVVGACGPFASIGTPAATASSVAVQSSDVPGGMQRCDLHGNINDYLKMIQTKDPATYNTIKQQWAAAQKDGATDADVEFYADTTAHCTALASNGALIGTATHKLVVNFVFKFKDQASAEKGYRSDSIFGFSAASFKSSQVPVVEGTATGLGPNSIVLTIAIPNQAFYVAVWQNKEFMVILGLLNIDSAADKKIAQAENGRIH
jgi:hypothetical protein